MLDGTALLTNLRFWPTTYFPRHRHSEYNLSICSYLENKYLCLSGGIAKGKLH